MHPTDNPAQILERRICACRRMARWSLGFVWLYEGLVPKVVFRAAHPEQTDLVFRSGLYWPTPEATLVVLGIIQAMLGIILLTGWRERLAVVTATAWMGVLMVLVGRGMPNLLTDPFGALAKDACLLACACVVWTLGQSATPQGKT